jgi:hypothetical protein
MSRPLRGQELGYRRLTVGVSLVLLCAGLALTARDSYRVVELYNARTSEAACREYNARRPATETPDECERVVADDYLSRPFSQVFHVLLTVAMGTFLRESVFVFDVASFMATHILAFTVALGIAVSLLLAAVPWVVFYSVRWIARGFDVAA